MAQQLEFERSPDFIPHTDLRDKSVIESLVRKGRIPFLMAHNGEMQMKTAICLIPPGDNAPSEKFELSLKDAKTVALIINELQRQAKH